MKRMLVALLFALPTIAAGAQAQTTTPAEPAPDTSIELASIFVLNDDGKAVERAEVNKNLRLIARIRNVNSTTFTGPVGVEYHIQSQDGLTAKKQVVTVNPTILPGAFYNVTFEYAPTQTGNHTLTVTLEKNAAETRTTSFVAGDTEVLEADLHERFISYGWFFAALVAAIVLFFAVVRVRKPGA